MPDPALLAGVVVSETGEPGTADALRLLLLFGAAVCTLVPGTGLPTTVLSLPSVSLSLPLLAPKFVASWSSIIVLSFLPRAGRGMVS